MDFYILNDNYERVALVENYESLIWTERYSSYGDFELTLQETAYNVNTYTVGRYLYTPDSNCLMVIENHETITEGEEDGVKISGRSFEALLEDRAVTMNATGEPYKTSGPPGGIATRIVRVICEEGSGYAAADKIDRLVTQGPSPSTFETEVEIPVKSVYAAVKEICDSDDLGFRIGFNPDTRILTFLVYRGQNRSVSGIEHPQIFSPEYDTLFEVKRLRSIENYKNVAYVVHNDRSRIVSVTLRNQAPATGVPRKVLVVDANDIEEPTLDNLRQRGFNALAEHNFTDLVDGEARMGPGAYRSRYNLGDTVELRDHLGFQTKVRVEEHVWSIDRSNGIRSYPTFKPA